jgi:sulfate transport system ATP-binding protein
LIEAVIPNEQYRALNLRDGETLLVKPRRMHVFVDQDLVEQGGGI